jgi:hypothetical protein
LSLPVTIHWMNPCLLANICQTWTAGTRVQRLLRRNVPPRIATTLMGDAVATNMFLLGFAWQRGFIPLEAQTLLRAIELKGAAIDMKQSAFAWGRQAALDFVAESQCIRFECVVRDLSVPGLAVLRTSARRLDLGDAKLNLLAGWY